MNIKGFLYSVGGLCIGLVVGFFAANFLNSSTNIQDQATRLPHEATLLDQQIQNIVVKDQPAISGVMPNIAETLEKAKNEPNNFDAQIAAGDLYARIQNLPKAIEHYEFAAKQKPSDYDAIVKLGNSYFDSRQFENAEVWYEKALNINPSDFAVRTDLGVTFVERSKPDLVRAINEFQTSLQTNSEHEPTLYNLALAYFKSGDLDLANRTAIALQKVNPNGELTNRIKKLVED